MNVMKTNTLVLFLGLYLLGYASATADDILRRLGKPACNDGTCRSDCAECPNGNDSSGNPCCAAPGPTPPPTTEALTNPYCPSGETCFCQHDETVGCR